MKKNFPYHILFFCFLIAASCKENKQESINTSQPLFQLLESNTTGLSFTNALTPTAKFNMFKYMYFYNGAGVGTGDFNNDGFIDIFFSSNQQQNKIFLNEGGLHFKDVTAEAKIPNDSAWHTGVSVADVNSDGLLDIYVCCVGSFETLHGHNQLLICKGIDKNGVPFYADEAKQYGLDFSGFSTQAAFFDYDGDGDLDMYLLNHSVHQNGTFAERSFFIGTYNPLSGDKIYRNDGNYFTDVTKQCGINSSAIGYGLGICVSDINLDGWADIYIGNDFHENDYLYINQHNGTFKEVLSDAMMHTSQFSMGVDIADVNNDAAPEIISVDMLPSDPYILKRSLGEDNYDLFYEKIGYGYNYQYTRNNLQYNRRNGMFSELGLYAGVAATDWSWAPLWMDFDNDGLKDLFISNGIPKRLNDIDYVNYVSNSEVQEKINADSVDDRDMALVNKYPEIKLPNAFFKNTGSVHFDDEENNIINNKPSFSNGAAYADFDNDGDLDIVVNNIADPVMLYENKTNSKNSISKHYLEIQLKGNEKNLQSTGAKCMVYAGSSIHTYEKFPVHGFQSSMEGPLHIGLNDVIADSILLVWPDNTYQKIDAAIKDTLISVAYKKGLPNFDYNSLRQQSANTTYKAENITQQTQLLYNHIEDGFNEFNREELLPHMLTTEGPALAVADVNHDGLDDVFIGAAKKEKPALFLQNIGGTFSKAAEPALDNDSVWEDIDACFADVNNDGNIDLIVASGGNEYYNNDEHELSRIYLSDGKANFSKLPGAIGNIYVTASCIVPYDFNGDGFADIFIGGRAVPWEYGKIPQSYLLQNDGTGKFKDVTAQYAKELAAIGFVTNAVWSDIDKDGDKDLVLSLEWGGICAFMNNKGNFEKRMLTTKYGWWNFVMPCDIDNDGDVDFIAGNLGLNSRLQASDEEPLRMYYNDFDDNGKKEQVLTYYLTGKEIPFANKDELQKQMPVLKKKFLYAQDFAKASLQDLFGEDKLKQAQKFTANWMYNSILINDGKLNFTVQPMPWQAQLSPYRTAAILNANDDTLPDILLLGNYYENNIEMGRYDADFGTILLNHGKDSFTCESLNDLQIKGQSRRVLPVTIAKQQAYVIARNNDSAIVIRFNKR